MVSDAERNLRSCTVLFTCVYGACFSSKVVGFSWAFRVCATQDRAGLSARLGALGFGRLDARHGDGEVVSIHFCQPKGSSPLLIRPISSLVPNRDTAKCAGC
jgi:hypothetical protein